MSRLESSPSRPDAETPDMGVFQRCRRPSEGERNILVREGLPLLGAEDHRMDVAARLRGLELDLLLRRWARAKAGDGQVVPGSGEPGLGKVGNPCSIRGAASSASYWRQRASPNCADDVQNTEASYQHCLTASRSARTPGAPWMTRRRCVHGGRPRRKA
jgi:hypothetical protein